LLCHDTEGPRMMWLWTFFLGILLVAGAMMPLWRAGYFKISLLCACLAFAIYGYLGALPKLYEKSDLQNQTQKMVQRLQNEQGQAEVLSQLKMIVDNNPDDAQGWYWLGRMAMGAGKSQLALASLQKAHLLAPDLPVVSYYYALSYANEHGGTLDKYIIEMLTELLKTTPEQTNVLALLAQDAAGKKHWQDARDYWQKLLQSSGLSPEDRLQIESKLQGIKNP
jgi:cytochrome c-type biogenesis protein CcmH